jgi:hypothetical protein
MREEVMYGEVVQVEGAQKIRVVFAAAMHGLAAMATTMGILASGKASR